MKRLFSVFLLIFPLFSCAFNNCISATQFGTKGNGTNDDYQALINGYNAAVAKKTCYSIPHPLAYYRVSSGLDFNGTIDVFGDAAEIRPDATVTGATIKINSGGGGPNPYGYTISGLILNGINTLDGAIGLHAGESTLTNFFTVDQVSIINYKGGSLSRGMVIKQVVTADFTHMYLNFNATNFLIDPSAGDGSPTTVRLMYNAFRSATIGSGGLIIGGYQVLSKQNVYENNTQAGLVIDTTGVGGSNVIDFVSEDDWFEGNWPSDGTKFQFLVNGGVANTTRLSIIRPFLNGNSSTAKSISIIGTNDQFDIVHPDFGSSAVSQININGSVGVNVGGTIDLFAWQNYSTLVTDPNAYATNVNTTQPYTQWTDWTPTYTPFGSMTFGTVTTTAARYKIAAANGATGKTANVDFLFSGTTGGAAASGITISLPSGVIPKTTGMRVPCSVNNAGTLETGYVEYGGTDGLYLRRANTVNFSLGANTGASCSFVMEIQ